MTSSFLSLRRYNKNSFFIKFLDLVSTILFTLSPCSWILSAVRTTSRSFLSRVFLDLMSFFSSKFSFRPFLLIPLTGSGEYCRGGGGRLGRGDTDRVIIFFDAAFKWEGLLSKLWLFTIDPRLAGARLRARFFKMDLGLDSREFGQKSVDRDSDNFSREEVEPFFLPPVVTSWFPQASNNREPRPFLPEHMVYRREEEEVMQFDDFLFPTK